MPWPWQSSICDCESSYCLGLCFRLVVRTTYVVVVDREERLCVGNFLKLFNIAV